MNCQVCNRELKYYENGCNCTHINPAQDYEPLDSKSKERLVPMKIEPLEKNPEYIQMSVRDMKVGTLFYINNIIDQNHLRLKVNEGKYLNMNSCILEHIFHMEGSIVPHNIKFVISNQVQ